MKPPRRLLIALLTVLVGLGCLTGVHAQNAAPNIGYYTAPDDGGVRQVYQTQIIASATPRQITQAGSDVLAFGVAYDGLSIAYIADKQLWLQPIHTAEAEALTTLTSTDFVGSLVFSPDGQSIAYTDGGVWLYDLGTRQTRQLVAHIPPDFKTPNVGQLRVYQPAQFALDPGGKVTALVVDIGLWEGQTVGIIDLTTGQLQELDGRSHTHLLPIYGGRALLYGNNPFAGSRDLHIAARRDDINSNTNVLDFRSISAASLFADQAAEIAPGIVRVYGSTFDPSSGGTSAFYFDYDLHTGRAGKPSVLPLVDMLQNDHITTSTLSPDGRFVAVTNDVTVDTPRGRIALLDLENARLLNVPLADGAADFAWQPRP